MPRNRIWHHPEAESELNALQPSISSHSKDTHTSPKASGSTCELFFALLLHPLCRPHCLPVAHKGASSRIPGSLATRHKMIRNKISPPFTSSDTFRGLPVATVLLPR